MTLEQLRIFIAVAEQEHMTRAASVLNLTQSATSAAIAALESRHATKLFDRIGRNIRLTDAGRLFLVEARAVVARADAAETVLADFAGLKLGSFALAASQTVGNYWLPPQMYRFHARYPGVRLTLKIGNTEQVTGWIHEGTADLGFIEGPADDPVLAVKPIAHDELALVVGPSHPWSGKRSLTPDQMKAAAWVTREQGSGTRQVFENALAGFDVARKDIDIAFTLPSNESVCTAVAAGGGATIISRLVANSLLASGALVAIDVKLPERRFFSVRHKERYETQAERAFVKQIAGQS